MRVSYRLSATNSNIGQVISCGLGLSIVCTLNEFGLPRKATHWQCDQRYCAC